MSTVAKRKEWTAARREELRDRDARRIELLDELAARTGLSVPEDDGYLVVPPGEVAEAGPAIEAANGLIDSIGEAALIAGKKKKDPMAKHVVPEEDYDL